MPSPSRELGSRRITDQLAQSLARLVPMDEEHEDSANRLQECTHSFFGLGLVGPVTR